MNEKRISLPLDFAPAGAFLLKVQDDNLTDVHICKGDYVLVHPDKNCEPGDIAVRSTSGGAVIIEHYQPNSPNVIGQVRGVLRVIKR